MSGNFEGTIGIQTPANVNQDPDYYFKKSLILLIFFLVFSLLLITSILKTIITSPGGIPDEQEWDMISESGSEANQDNESIKSDDELKDY